MHSSKQIKILCLSVLCALTPLSAHAEEAAGLSCEYSGAAAGYSCRTAAAQGGGGTYDNCTTCVALLCIDEYQKVTGVVPPANDPFYQCCYNFGQAECQGLPKTVKPRIQA
jgi:hypothetical protein